MRASHTAISHVRLPRWSRRLLMLLALGAALGAALSPRGVHACTPASDARPAPIAVHVEQAELVARVRIEQVSEREPLFNQSATMTVLEPIKGALTETLVVAGFGDGVDCLAIAWPGKTNIVFVEQRHGRWMAHYTYAWDALAADTPRNLVEAHIGVGRGSRVLLPHAQIR